MKSQRISLATAGAFLVIELLIGIGVVGGAGFFVAAICLGLYVIDRRSLPNALGTAAIFAILGILTLSWINFNWRVAERRAQPIIVACEGFQDRYGQFPKSLNQLTPEFLPSIPNAKYTIVANKFRYASTPAHLSFAVMFHGVATYDFASHKWWTND